MALVHGIVVLLVLASAVHTLGSRVLLDDTLTCMTTVTRDGNGNALQTAALSPMTQKRFNSLQSSVPSQGAAACLRMKVRCADGNNVQHCTQADNAAKVWKWAYMLTVQPVCEYYKTTGVAGGYVKDVTCCTNNGCNFDRAMDTTTKVVQLGTRAQP